MKILFYTPLRWFRVIKSCFVVDASYLIGYHKAMIESMKDVADESVDNDVIARAYRIVATSSREISTLESVHGKVDLKLALQINRITRHNFELLDMDVTELKNEFINTD